MREKLRKTLLKSEAQACLVSLLLFVSPAEKQWKRRWNGEGSGVGCGLIGDGGGRKARERERKKKRNRDRDRDGDRKRERGGRR